MILLSDRKCKKKHHVSYDTVLGFENAFLCNHEIHLRLFSPIVYFLNRVLRKIRMDIRFSDLILLRKIKEEKVIYISMGLEDVLMHKNELGFVSKRNELGIYCFDVWGSQMELYEKVFAKIKPTHLFFAYYEAYNYFNDTYDCMFIPQSMDSRFFYPRAVEKTRLFIQIGRKNEAIHEKILSYLTENNIDISDDNYIFEKEKGKILFPETDELAYEISKSKYFVAAPQSKENSQMTGKVSDVTARFYEAMACKTLIIGYKPDTFDLLFPIDAMIDLENDKRPFGEIISWFENNHDEYLRIVNRNYELLMRNHTWEERCKDVISAFN